MRANPKSPNGSEGERLHAELSRAGIVGAILHDDAEYERAAHEFSRPYRERIAELEAENARRRSVSVSPGSTLVLIAPETASQDEMHDAAKRAGDAHDGPVIVMPYDWQSISADELRTKLDSVAGRRTAPTSDHAHEIGSCSYCDKGGVDHNERKS